MTIEQPPATDDNNVGPAQCQVAPPSTLPPNARRIVICCDGTSNKPDVTNPTNVVRIARGIAPRTSTNASQIVFYDWGVGTGNKLDRITGGAFGWGLGKNVGDAYRFLVQNYCPGDQIILFGFSRGAFTARAVAGLIRKCGILRPDSDDKVGEAFALYQDVTAAVDGEAAVEFRQANSYPMPIIEFVGVFDTVGAMGFPFQRAVETAKFWPRLIVIDPFRKLFRRSATATVGKRRQKSEPRERSWWGTRHRFYDMELSRWVKNGYHALAIDERRPVFTPNLWDSELRCLPKVADADLTGKLDWKTVGDSEHQQSVQQVWFPGAHSDVGGNSKRHNSAVAREWMAAAAQARSGLEFEKHFWQEILDDLGKDWSISGSPPYSKRKILGMPIKGPWWIVGWKRRDMTPLYKDTERIHPFALARHEKDPEYKITNLGREDLKPSEDRDPGEVAREMVASLGAAKAKTPV